jgi:vacuolar iron transporter family protein
MPKWSNSKKRFMNLQTRIRNMPSDTKLIELAKTGLKTELTATEIYNRLRKKLKRDPFSEKLGHYAEAEERPAEFWIKFLRERKVNTQAIKYNPITVSMLVFIYSLLGLGLSLKLLESGERKVILLFSKVSLSENLTPQEATDIRGFLHEELLHEESFLDYESKFRIFIDKIGTIFTQTSDGLVIVISTSVGLAGVYTNSFLIGASGLIIGIAATLDTVIKTYFFGRTERRFKRDILKKLRISCELAPEAYERRIEKYMKKKNYDEETANRIATIARQKNMIEQIIAEEEYGIKDKELDSPIRTALQAGAFKFSGIILPLIPFLSSYPLDIAIPASVIIMIVLLSVVGSIAAIVAELNVKKKVAELTLTGLVLSIITYLVARLVSILATAANLA